MTPTDRVLLCVQLFVQGDDLALNLHNAKPGGFGDDSEHVALLFASQAAVAMAGAQKQEQLRTGMQTRDVIGQAKGILMGKAQDRRRPGVLAADTGQSGHQPQAVPTSPSSCYTLGTVAG